MKLIYTDTNGQGKTDIVHAYTCTDGQRLLRAAQSKWNWDVFEAGNRAEALDLISSQYDLAALNFCPCVPAD